MRRLKRVLVIGAVIGVVALGLATGLSSRAAAWTLFDWSLGNTATYGQRVLLPATVPADRRDSVTFEVVEGCTINDTTNGPQLVFDDVGSCTVSVIEGINRVTVQVIVRKALVSVAPVSGQTIAYGSSAANESVAWGPFVPGDSASDIDVAPTCPQDTSRLAVGTFNVRCVGGSDDHYDFSYGAVPLTVTRKPITLTPRNAVRPQAAPNPSFDFDVTGLVNGDTKAAVSGVTLATFAALDSPEGEYDIVFAPMEDPANVAGPNYAPTFGTGTLTVTDKKLPKILFNTPHPSVYGVHHGSNIEVEAPDWRIASATGSCTKTGDHDYYTSGVGMCFLTIESDADQTYVANSQSIGYFVSKRPLAVSPSRSTQQFIYGTRPSITPLLQTYDGGAVQSGLVAGDSLEDIDVAPQCPNSLSERTPVGAYSVGCGGGSDDHYELYFYGFAQVFVQPATLTLQPHSQMASSTSSLAEPLSYSVAGWTNDDEATYGHLVEDLELYLSDETSVPGDVSQIRFRDVPTIPNYDVVVGHGAVKIGRNIYEATAVPELAVYGDTVSIEAQHVRGVGASGACSGNYLQLTMVRAGVCTVDLIFNAENQPASALVRRFVFDVAKRQLDVSLPSIMWKHGDTPDESFTMDGFINGEGVDDFAALPVCRLVVPSVANVSQPRTCGDLGWDEDYRAVVTNAGIQTWLGRVLVFRPDNIVRAYGDPNPPLTFKVDGFFDGTSPNGVYSGGELFTTATPNSPVGTYPIIFGSLPTVIDQRYSIPPPRVGTLTIEKRAPQFVNLEAFIPSQAVYGDSVELRASSSDGRPATWTAEGCSAVENNGAWSVVFDAVGTCTVTGSQPGDANRMPSANTIVRKIQVVKRLLSTVGRTTLMNYGDTPPVIRPSVGGFVLGDTTADLDSFPACTSAASATSNVGIYQVSCPSGAGLDDNYVWGRNDASNISIGRRPLTIRANDATRPYGEPTPTLTYTITGVKNGDSVSVVLFAPSETSTSPVGSTHEIRIKSQSIGTNYAIGQYVPALLRITKGLAVITAATGEPDKNTVELRATLRRNIGGAAIAGETLRFNYGKDRAQSALVTTDQSGVARLVISKAEAAQTKKLGYLVSLPSSATWDAAPATGAVK